MEKTIPQTIGQSGSGNLCNAAATLYEKPIRSGQHSCEQRCCDVKTTKNKEQKFHFFGHLTGLSRSVKISFLEESVPTRCVFACAIFLPLANKSSVRFI
jgi:hypothetical protein